MGDVSVRMSVELLARLRRASVWEQKTEAGLIRDAVEEAVKKIERAQRRAKRRHSVDERLLARWRVLVAGALLEATDWTSLQKRLALDDLAFVASGGGLALARQSTGEALCRASDVGPGYAALVRRFRSGFPDHPHVWLAERILGVAPPRARSDQVDMPGAGGDIDALIKHDDGS